MFATFAGDKLTNTTLAVGGRLNPQPAVQAHWIKS